MLDRLEKAGYVRRESDPNDRRRVIVQPITERSRQLGEHFDALNAAIQKACDGYDDQQLDLLVDYFDRIRPIMADETARLRDSREGGPLPRGELALPLAGAQRGRLELQGGATRLDIRGDSELDALCRAEFEGPAPTLRAQGGNVIFRTARSWPFHHGSRGTHLVLNAAVLWEVVVRGGALKLDANLRELRLELFELAGGACDVTVRLPAPHGETRVRISGGASKVSLVRPAGTAASLRGNGGTSRLTFDGQRFRSIGGVTYLTTPDYQDAADRYDFEIIGGASRVSVESE